MIEKKEILKLQNEIQNDFVSLIRKLNSVRVLVDQYVNETFGDPMIIQENVYPGPEVLVQKPVSPVVSSVDKKINNAMPSYSVVCSNCGVPTTVQFKPNLKRPVYCYNCYKGIMEKKNDR